MFCDLSLAFASLEKGCDLKLTGADLQGDSTLYTAVLISLFTDRVAEVYEELPAGEFDRKGWWGDALDDSPANSGGTASSALQGVVKPRKLGSKLWLLRREKQVSSVVAKAEQYAREALAWMLEDKLVSKVEVKGSIVRGGVLGLKVGLAVPLHSASRLPQASYEAERWTFFYDYKNALPLG